MNDSATSSSFTFVEHWQKGDTANADAVLQFWEREGALATDAKPQERLRQVVLDARDADGRVAGVSTAVPITLPRLGQPTYYFRCFIGKNWRKSRLVLHLLRRTYDALEDFARQHNFPCVGVVLELENTRFGEVLQQAQWPATAKGFVFIGKSQRGLDLRVRYFRGAKLKPAKI